jgi:hypothetical protein
MARLAKMRMEGGMAGWHRLVSRSQDRRSDHLARRIGGLPTGIVVDVAIEAVSHDALEHVRLDR